MGRLDADESEGRRMLLRNKHVSFHAMTMHSMIYIVMHRPIPDALIPTLYKTIDLGVISKPNLMFQLQSHLPKTLITFDSSIQSSVINSELLTPKWSFSSTSNGLCNSQFII